jgi:formylglycine-generating enzyme required for sulfatase activity
MSPLGFSTHVELSGLSPNTTYYWQAKSVDDDGTTYANASSDSYWSFTTGADDIITADMISIPAGDFQMGCDPEHNDGFDCASDELPLHSVYLDAYKIDKYEVTTSQYAECVEAGVCGLPNYDVTVSNRFPYFGNPVYANYPVIGVTWYQANDYCAWAGKRLPTEAEWEKAARGSTGTNPYPWGESSPTCDLANLPLCVVDTDQVGSYPSGASPYGVMDMSGNVKEWVSDWYGESYYSGSPRNNPQGPASGVYKVLRGGSWVSDDDRLRLSSRSWTYRSSPEPDFGFRCVAPNE